MTWQIVSLLFFFIIIARTTIDARAIQQDTIHQLVNDPITENEELFTTLTNYRHRFEYSNNIKALQWMFRQHSDPEEVYCKICHILLPVVSEISSLSHFHI
jgi:hypothetical protein